MMPPLRQGDVIITPTAALRQSSGDTLRQSSATTAMGNKLPHLTLAEGEVTGHSHRISQGEAELYERDGTLYLKVLSSTALLTHEEHESIAIPQGDWMIRIQREYEPQGWRYVAD